MKTLKKTWHIKNDDILKCMNCGWVDIAENFSGHMDANEFQCPHCNSRAVKKHPEPIKIKAGKHKIQE